MHERQDDILPATSEETPFVLFSPTQIRCVCCAAGEKPVGRHFFVRKNDNFWSAAARHGRNAPPKIQSCVDYYKRKHTSLASAKISLRRRSLRNLHGRTLEIEPATGIIIENRTRWGERAQGMGIVLAQGALAHTRRSLLLLGEAFNLQLLMRFAHNSPRSGKREI